MIRFIFILFITTNISAQNQDLTLGARAAGLGNLSSTLHDEWSSFNNVAGLSYLQYTILMVSYSSQYGLSDLRTVGAGAIKPLKTGVLGVSFYRFGSELYNQHKIGLGYANKFGLASIGIRLNYLQYSILNYGSRTAITMDFGGLAELTPSLTFGAQIFNLTQQQLAQFETEHIPTVMRAGLSYRASEQLIILIEIEKDIDFEAAFRSGIEYKVAKKLTLRTGLSTKPLRSYYGIGFRTKKLNIDYSFNNQSSLGNAHQMALGYHLKKTQ